MAAGKLMNLCQLLVRLGAITDEEEKVQANVGEVSILC